MKEERIEGKGVSESKIGSRKARNSMPKKMKEERIEGKKGSESKIESKDSEGQYARLS